MSSVIRRTLDEAPVLTCVGEVWDYLKDDTSMTFADWSPRIDDTSRWYTAMQDYELVGAFWMRQTNTITWEAHANVRPRMWGNKRGTALCKQAIDFMIDDTGARKVIALIPDCAPQVQDMAEAIGFEFEGIQTKSFLKHGKLYDQKYYGISL